MPDSIPVMPDLIGHLFVIAGSTPVMPDLIGHLSVIAGPDRQSPG